MGPIREGLPRHRGPAASSRPMQAGCRGGPQGAAHPPIADGAPCERAAGRGPRLARLPSPARAGAGISSPACPAWPYVGAAPRRGSHQEPGCPRRQARPLLLGPALNPGLLQQLAVLLLRHPLAAFLDDRAHQAPLSSAQGRRACHHAHPRTGAGQTPEIGTDVNADRSRSPQDYLLPPSAVTVWSAIRPLRAGQTPRRLAGR